MFLVANQIAFIYQESLFLPAYNIPYYIILIGLSWVVWQTAKFMSGSEAAIAFKYR